MSRRKDAGERLWRVLHAPPGGNRGVSGEHLMTQARVGWRSVRRFLEWWRAAGLVETPGALSISQDRLVRLTRMGRRCTAPPAIERGTDGRVVLITDPEGDPGDVVSIRRLPGGRLIAERRTHA